MYSYAHQKLHWGRSSGVQTSQWVACPWLSSLHIRPAHGWCELAISESCIVANSVELSRVEREVE